MFSWFIYEYAHLLFLIRKQIWGFFCTPRRHLIIFLCSVREWSNAQYFYIYGKPTIKKTYSTHKFLSLHFLIGALVSDNFRTCASFERTGYGRRDSVCWTEPVYYPVSHTYTALPQSSLLDNYVATWKGPVRVRDMGCERDYGRICNGRKIGGCGRIDSVSFDAVWRWVRSSAIGTKLVLV